jgi:hypothetical protein
LSKRIDKKKTNKNSINLENQGGGDLSGGSKELVGLASGQPSELD